MASELTLFCWILGRSSTFPIDINPNKTIGHLKDAIAAKDPNLLPAYNMRLYKRYVPVGEKHTIVESELNDPLSEVDDVGEHFDGVLPKKSVHVFIVLRSDVLSQSEFLQLRPPPFTYDRALSTATTYSTFARTPHSVITWDAFVADVNNTAWDHTPRYSRPTFQQDLIISCELDVQNALWSNVFHPFKILLEQGEKFGRSSSFVGVVGEPDFIQKDLNGLRLVIEVKTEWSLSADDLVTAYAQNIIENKHKTTFGTPVLNQLRQIFGYLSHNHLQFGALTTYEKTWFLYRPTENPSQLCISPPIQYDSQQPTLFQCFFYLTLLARGADECASAPPSPSPSPPPLPLPSYDDSPPDDEDEDPSYDGSDNSRPKRKAGSQNTRGKKSKRGKGDRTPMAGGGSRVMIRPNHPSNGEVAHGSLEFFDWGSFRILNVLGNGRSGTVFKAILHGEIVALKVCDLWQHPDYKKELFNEVDVYHALKDLQGDCIPRLKGAGYTAGGLFVIATEIVGRHLEDTKNLSDEERQVIKKALLSVHRHGFVHNDIRKENIIIKCEGSQFSASLVDFAFAKKGSQRDFYNERRLLARLLA